MTWDAWFAMTTWLGFFGGWLPWQVITHRKRMRSLRAINKGYRFRLKYIAIKQLNSNLTKWRLHENRNRS